MKEIIINANRQGYGTDQIYRTMTVGQLIEWLEELSDGDMDTKVYVGNDRRDYGWYTYGGVQESDVVCISDEGGYDDEI